MDPTCDLAFEPGDSSVVAEVRDPQGAGGCAELAITVLATEAPTAENLSPQADSVYYSDRLITYSALISDGEDDLLPLNPTQRPNEHLRHHLH